MKGAVLAKIAANSLASEVTTMLDTPAALDPALLDAAFRAWSANTRRAFRSDLLLWGRWCRRRKIRPAQAQPADVARWIRELAAGKGGEGKGRAVATIERYLVHVGRAYRLTGLPSPVAAEARTLTSSHFFFTAGALVQSRVTRSLPPIPAP